MSFKIQPVLGEAKYEKSSFLMCFKPSLAKGEK
jgi:hypothetical protein